MDRKKRAKRSENPRKSLGEMLSQLGLSPVGMLGEDTGKAGRYNRFFQAGLRREGLEVDGVSFTADEVLKYLYCFNHVDEFTKLMMDRDEIQSVKDKMLKAVERDRKSLEAQGLRAVIEVRPDGIGDHIERIIPEVEGGTEAASA